MEKKFLEVVVIGVQGALRNPFLESQLVDFDVRYIEPVTVLGRAQIEPEAARVANRQIIGRDLLNAEIGCSLAHESARAAIVADWGLILEDDAQIRSEAIHRIVNLVSQISFSGPTVITLFDEAQVSVQKLMIERLNHMPGMAIAYLASRSTADLDGALNSRIGTADWPLSFLGANFFALRGTGVSEFGSLSTIDAAGERGTRSGAYYKNAISNLLPVLKCYGKDAVKYSLLLPARRDFANRKRRAKKLALSWIGLSRD